MHKYTIWMPRLRKQALHAHLFVYNIWLRSIDEDGRFLTDFIVHPQSILQASIKSNLDFSNRLQGIRAYSPSAPVQLARCRVDFIHADQLAKLPTHNLEMKLNELVTKIKQAPLATLQSILLSKSSKRACQRQ